MSIVMPEMGERTNALINELYNQKKELNFFLNTVKGQLKDAAYDASDLLEFWNDLGPDDVSKEAKLQGSEELMGKYSDLLDEMHNSQHPDAEKMQNVQVLALATYLMLEEPNHQKRVAVGLEALIWEGYPESQLREDIEAYLVR